TASGGKIRARRFASGKPPHKPLYRIRKTHLRNRTRVGAPILGQTIGNLVAGSIAQSGQERALRRAGVERSVEAFRNQFGDTAEVAAYEEAGLYAANHPGSSEGRSNLDQAARILLQANGSDPEVAAFLNHVDPVGAGGQAGDITVTGHRGYLFGSTIDNAGIWVGEKGQEIAQGVGQFIQNHPGIGIALTLADGAFAVVAPVKYLGGMALDYFKDEATGFIADKMTGPQLWSVEKGQAGGGGFVLAGGIALSGLGAIGGGLKLIGGSTSTGSAGGFSGAYATNGDLVQSIATRADNWGIRNGMGNGPLVGTAKHGYAEALLNRHQRMFGDRGLTAEARYIGGAPWQPGMTTTGSIRLDVVEGPLANPTHVWDYKFGQATLSPSRTTQIQNGIPNGANVPILMVKP
ncbi:hypothetical protein, partial [Flavobacterium sp.]|uniref:hypothetical protein n=1 Tax=Flavobacterium sp. TaxID=239 RepID=UPI0032669E24